MNKSLSRILYIVLFDQISVSITFPILTLLFFSTDSNLFSAHTPESVRAMWYGICISLPHFLNIFFAPFLSCISDSIGRRKVLLAATVGAAVFGFAAAFGIIGGMLVLLLFGRVVQGTLSRINPIAQAIIGDVCDKDKKLAAMGYLQFVISVGCFIGPLLGGYFANRFFFSDLNYSLPFFLSGLVGFFAFLYGYKLFLETHTKRHPHKKLFEIRIIRDLLKNRIILLCTIILIFNQTSWSFYYQYTPPIIKVGFHFSAMQIGLFVSLVELWLAIGSTVFIQLLKRYFNLEQILTISIVSVLFGTTLTSIACLNQSSTFWHGILWLSAIPTAAGDVITFSCITAIYSNLTEKHQQGNVMGLCFLVVGITWGITGLLGGFLAGINILLPLIVAPLAITVSLVISLMIGKQKLSLEATYEEGTA